MLNIEMSSVRLRTSHLHFRSFLMLSDLFIRIDFMYFTIIGTHIDHTCIKIPISLLNESLN